MRVIYFLLFCVFILGVFVLQDKPKFSIENFDDQVLDKFNVQALEFSDFDLSLVAENYYVE